MWEARGRAPGSWSSSKQRDMLFRRGRQMAGRVSLSALRATVDTMSPPGSILLAWRETPGIQAILYSKATTLSVGMIEIKYTQ